MKKVEQKVIEFISHYSLINVNDRLLISFSGGPDSVFALHFLSKFRRKYNIELTAVHFDHGLRGKESDADEEFSIEFCKQYNIPIITKEIDVKGFAYKNKMSVEEAARILRYDLLESIRKELRFNKIVTAHNQSDNTETILLNICSGTGVTGFTGIPIQRGNIIRPFLCLTKKEIVDYLDNSGIKYRIDSSNLDSEFKRNFLRNQIIPLLRKNINPSLDGSIFRSSKILESFIPTIKKQVEKKSSGLVTYLNGSLLIALKFFELSEEGILGDIVKSKFKKYFKYEFGYNDLKKIIRLSSQQKGKSVQLRKGLIALKEKDHVLVEKSNSTDKQLSVRVGLNSNTVLLGKKVGIEKTDLKKVILKRNKNVEFVNADKLSGIFILRRWKNGDKFIPLGMKNFKKVSDFLTDEKISSANKKNQLVLTNRNNIVWVVGLRIDDRYKINSQTKEIYKLWVQ